MTNTYTDTYKDSGIEWIGKIPQDWNINRNKNVFSYNKEIVGSKSAITQLLSLTKKGVIEKDINNAEGKLPESFDTYQYVKKNDIVMCLFDLDCSAVFSGISNYCGMISPAYKLLRCKNIIPKYADYWFAYIGEERKFKHYAKNIRYTLNFEEFADLPILTPPQDKQQQIADYLDKKCGEIDGVVETQKEVIEKLKEYKQSVITQAVTKGLDKSVLLKDSGIEWIGKIPQHWGIMRLKQLISTPLQYGANESGDKFDTNHPRYIRITDIKIEDNSLKDEGKLSLSPEKAKDYLLKDNDILFARSGATVGKTFLYKQKYGLSAFAGYLIRASINKDNMIAKFVYYYTLSNSYEEWKNRIFIQATIQNIGANKYNNLELPIPKINEQKQIIEYLDKKCSKIDKAISDKEQVIEKLTEYKKSLIYECVTGKRKVTALRHCEE